MVESSCTRHPQLTPLAVTSRKPPDCFSGSSSEQLSSCVSLPCGEELHELFCPLCTLCVPKGGSWKAPYRFCIKASEMGVIGKKIACGWSQHTLPIMALSVEWCMWTLCAPPLPPAQPQARQPLAAPFLLAPGGGKKWQRAVFSALKSEEEIGISQGFWFNQVQNFRPLYLGQFAIDFSPLVFFFGVPLSGLLIDWVSRKAREQDFSIFKIYICFLHSCIWEFFFPSPFYTLLYPILCLANIPDRKGKWCNFKETPSEPSTNGFGFF